LLLPGALQSLQHLTQPVVFALFLLEPRAVVSRRQEPVKKGKKIDRKEPSSQEGRFEEKFFEDAISHKALSWQPIFFALGATASKGIYRDFFQFAIND
jgi:hypothetical protein